MSRRRRYKAQRIREQGQQNDPRETQKKRVTEQIDPTVMSGSTGTQEDWYWSKLTNGTDEDFLWRRLSDQFYLKDVIPSTYLEIHNQCFEAYQANPLAF